MNNIKQARNILETSLNAVNSSIEDLELYEAKEAMQLIIDWLADDCKNDNLDLDDLPCGKVVVVHEDNLLSTIIDRLEGDEYILGSHYAEFLASCTGWPQMLIEAAQKGGAYQELGEVIIQDGFVETMAQAKIDNGWCGEELNGYDGEEHETGAFRVYRTN
jgi:hypothetical protein